MSERNVGVLERSNERVVSAAGNELLDVAFVGTVSSPDDARHEGISQAANNFQLELLKSLLRKGLDPWIFSVRFRRFFPTGPFYVSGGRSSFENLSIKYLPFLNHPLLQAPMLALQIVPLIARWGLRSRRRGRRGVVLLYNLYPIPGIAVQIGCILGRASAVVIAADVHVPGETRPDDVLHRFDFYLQKMALRRADGIIALTREVVDGLAPGVPFLVVDGAIPDERLLEVPVSVIEDRSANDPFIIMYAGQLSELKGIPLLLDAFRKTDDQTLRLWISGRGECEDVVRAAAARDDRITFWGYGSYGELLDLYGRATILVNPHRTDLKSAGYMFPSKLIEYMAAGRPVISTPGPGVREGYGRYVAVLDDDSIGSLVAVLGRMIGMSTSALSEMATKAREFVVREKSWDRQSNRIEDFLSRVVVGTQFGTGGKER